ncbi:MAG: chromate transporter [Armatimonadetes bacterium]|nr:chromate transporter [Armatimonadota bacterium]
MYPPQPRHDERQRPFVPLKFLRAWLLVGCQSFGGGVATLALLHRMAVEQEEWLSEEEFTRDWALSQAAPGINLLALTILIGHRVAGANGILLSLVGLLLPTTAITVVLTASYAHIRHSPVVEAALKGILPATVGLGLLTSWQMIRPLLKESHAEGRGSGAFSLLLLAGCALLSFLRFPVVYILLFAAVLGAFYRWKVQPRKGTTGESPS